MRGINSDDKWRSIREKIDESDCSIVCLQETKRDNFEHSYVKNFAPKRFDKFVYSPSVGASVGLLFLWNSAIFQGNVIH